MSHEIFAALATGLHLFGLSTAQILSVLVLVVLVLMLLKKKSAQLVRPLKVFAERHTLTSALARWDRRSNGPDWEEVALIVTRSAYFVQSVDANGMNLVKQSLFQVLGDPKSQYVMKKRAERKIHIFFCQGIRPLIPWIDYMYLRMLKELMDAGCRVVILSHNDEFKRDSEKHLRPTILRSNEKGFALWRAHLQRLFGSEFPKKLHLGKEYIVKNRKLVEGYIKFIYDDVTSLYASDQTQTKTPDQVPSASEFANIIDSFACSSLMSSNTFVLYFGWEKQTVKWTQGALKELSKKLSDGFVVGATVKKEAGHRVDVYSSEHVLNLFDIDEKMATKLFGRVAGTGGQNTFFTDLLTVRNICVGAARLDEQHWDYLTMNAHLSPHDLEAKLNEYRDALRPFLAILTDDLNAFVANANGSHSSVSNDVGIQVCARCAAYSSMRLIRDGEDKRLPEASLSSKL